jgi:hypothetical protein
MVSPTANNLQVSAMPKRDFHFPVPVFLLATRLANTDKGKKIILASSVLWMFPGFCSTVVAGGLIYYGFKNMDRFMYYDRNYKQLNDPEMKRKCKEFFKRSQFMKDSDMEEARRFIQSTMKRGGEKMIEISENIKPEHFEKFKAPKRDYQHQTNELKGQAIRSIGAVFNSPQLYQSLHLTREQKLQFGGLFENPHELEFGSVEFVKQDSGLFSGDTLDIQFNIVSNNTFVKVEAKGANHDGHMSLVDLTLKSIDGQVKLNVPVHMNHHY